MDVQKAFKYRLYPTPEQEAQLRQHCGNVRFVWNQLLGMQTDHWKATGKTLLINSAHVTALRHEHEFLQLSYCNALHEARLNLNKAWKAFVAARKRGEPDAGKPKFKSRRSTPSFTLPRASLLRPGKTVRNGSLDIKGVDGPVKWRKHRPLEGKPKRLTVSCQGGKWYAAIMCEVALPDPPEPTPDLVGIDVGLAMFATLSDGTTVPNPRFFAQMQRRKAHAQRNLSRKKQRSGGFRKAKRRVQKVEAEIADMRGGFLHQLSSDLVARYPGFAVENLNVKGMQKNRYLARSIADVAWGQLCQQLEYKARWYGKHFVKIDRFAPSTKRCSVCGATKEMPLSTRIYRCGQCGHVEDRDLNAAKNIRKLGLAQLGLTPRPVCSGLEKPVETPIRAPVKPAKDSGVNPANALFPRSLG